MAIRFQCISCKSSISVHDQFAKRQVRCPHCGFQLIVPKRDTQRPVQDAILTDLAPLHTSTPDLVTAPNDSENDWLGSLSAYSESTPADYFEDSQTADVAATDDASDNRSDPPQRRVATHEEEELEWDVTPMVDVAFLLLIFFMITASFSIQKAIPTAPPQTDNPGAIATTRSADQFSDVLVLQVDEFNGYTLVALDGSEHLSSSKQELIGQFQDIPHGDDLSAVKVLVQAHNMSTHGAVVSGIDAARKAGLVNFQIQAVDEF